MKRTMRWVILLALLPALPTWAQQTPSGAGEGAHVHYAWANVTRVDPVYHMLQVANPGSVCSVAAGDAQPGKSTSVAAPAASRARPDGGSAAASTKAAPACVPAPASEERRIVGYNVEYRYRGNVYMSRLDYDPGERLRVRISVTPAD